MDKQKKYRKNYGIPFFSMAFLAALVFEFYWILVNPYDYFMIIGIGIIMIITGYLTVDSILKAKSDADAEKAEQNDMMLKAQKAIYIATKKNAKDAEVRQAQSVKAVELMMNKMITSQQALLEEKKTDGDDMTSLIDQLSASNAKLAKEVQSAITVNQLVKANADLVRNVKEALNASAMNADQGPDLSSYVSAAINTPVAPAQPVVAPEPVVVPQAPVVTPTPVVAPEPVIIPEVVAEPEPEPIVVPEIVAEPEPEPIIIEDADILSSDNDLGFDLNELDLSTMPTEDGSLDSAMDDIENEINLAKMAESLSLEGITVPDEMTPELDAAMDDGSDIVVDTLNDSDLDIAAEDSNPFSAKVDDSPNRQLTEEEIAALFASL